MHLTWKLTVAVLILGAFVFIMSRSHKKKHAYNDSQREWKHARDCGDDVAMDVTLPGSSSK